MIDVIFHQKVTSENIIIFSNKILFIFKNVRIIYKFKEVQSFIIKKLNILRLKSSNHLYRYIYILTNKNKREKNISTTLKSVP
jgi:hypothetical protein